MSLRDLLRIAEQAMGGPSSPQAPEEVVRAVLEATGSGVGVLRRGERVAARWPRSAGRGVEEATEGWTQVEIADGDDSWTLRLLRPERLDETVLGAARLALRAHILREELKRTRFDERFRLWELEAVRSIATSIGGILDRGRLAEELIAHLVALLGVRSAQLYLGADSTAAECVASFGTPALDDRDLPKAWLEEILSDELIAVPLESEGGTLGVLVAAHKEARAGTEPFAANDIRLVELFAIQVTVALEYVRLTSESLERERLRRELEVAAVIQSHLYPQRFPRLAGWRISGRSSSSRQVAGDTYDALVRNDQLLVAVTDVSGKGVGAGMLASGIHSGIRLLADESLTLPELAGRLNRYLVGATADNRFATMALIRLAPDGGLTAVNAGHCPILIRRRDGHIEQIDSGGLPLGILPAAQYSESSRQIECGDLVALYTDGLTEAENPAEDEFGVERTAQVLAELATPTADGACEALLNAVNRFAGGRPLNDDATLLVIERLPAEAEGPGPTTTDPAI